jgi:hypothetical protein
MLNLIIIQVCKIDRINLIFIYFFLYIKILNYILIRLLLFTNNNIVETFYTKLLYYKYNYFINIIKFK